jgi:putative ABC transport system permease protein
MALFELDHFHEILQTLRRNRLRTFLTACGIFWGVFMLVVMLGFGRGLEKAVEEDMGFFAINNIGFRAELTSKPYAGRQAGRKVWLTLDDVEAVRQVPGVEVAFGRNHFFQGRAQRGEKSLDSVITGDYPEIWLTESSVLARGRFLNPIDIKEARKVAVVGTRVVEVLFAPGEDPIGQTIKAANTTFQVVGVLDASGWGQPGRQRDFFNSRIFVPRPNLARMLGLGDRVTSIPVLVDKARSSLEVEDSIKALLKQRHQIAPDDERAIWSFNRDKSFQRFVNLFMGIRALSWVVGVLTLMAGAIGVSNIMMIAVAERTREIGVRKAIGATPLSIMGQIVAEATLLTALAGYLGLVAGVGLLEVAARIVSAMPGGGEGPRFFSSPELDIGKAVLAAAVLTVAGALAGLAPARAAVAVPPSVALAHE